MKSYIRRVAAQEEHAGNLEFDSHADTIVFGRNCVVLNYTGRVCNVSPFTDSYKSLDDVEIVTAATAWQSPVTGEVFILVFNEGLWMADHMENTLLNPNQLRHYGTTVQDNPYDATPLGIVSPEQDLAVPFQTKGTTILAETFSPSEEQLQTCRHIELSSPHPWNPQKVSFPSSSLSVEEEIDALRSNISSIESATDEEDADCHRLIFSLERIQRSLIAAGNTMHVEAERQISNVNQKEDAAQDVPERQTYQSSDRKTSVSPESIAERWGIGLKQAKQTLSKTTQNIVRSAIMPLMRRYRADRIFTPNRLKGNWHSDTVIATDKSKDGNTCAQIFTNDNYFAAIYPMDSKSKAGDALRVFCQEFGVPEHLTIDGSKEQTKKGTEFMKQIRKNNIDYHITEPERHNQNPAEGVIREIRRKWFRVMIRKRVPRKLWDYGYRWICEIQQRTHVRGHRIDGCVPLEEITGETIDISAYLDFGMYDYVWYRDNAGLGPQKLGRWLGVSHKIGSQMAYHILPLTCSPITRTSVQRITNLELTTTEVRTQADQFDAEIKRRLDEEDYAVDGDKPDPEAWADLIENDPDFAAEFQQAQDNQATSQEDSFTPEVLDDTYLRMELALPRDDEGPEFARVTKRLRDAEGRPIGTAHDNPILDTRIYEVEYQDGHTAAMSANAIAMNLFAQVDEDGHRHVLFDEIIAHRTNGKEVKQADAFITSRQGGKRRRMTTQGWEILVQWKDGSTTWVDLKDIKDSFPVELAEYAVQTKLSMEPAFAWWVPHVLRKRNRIIAKIKSKYWTRTHKFGIRVPKSVQEAKQLDEQNGDTLWWDAICKEMKNVLIAFEEYDGDVKDLVGYQKIDCHMIFDVKMGENFRRKARMVAGGHKTEAPASITYSSVVSRDSVRIALTIAALNDLKILSCDIQNAYLTAKPREKIYTIAGPEFGSDAGKTMIIVRALYGLKSSGAAFRAHLAEHLWGQGYRPTVTDPDVWLRAAVKPSGFEYYEYVLCYVDDVLAISHEPERTMNDIRKQFTLKNDKAEEPDGYLGAELAQMTTDNGTVCWTMGSTKYVKASVMNVEATLDKEGRRLPTKCFTPYSSQQYKPEEDTSPELKAEGVKMYQEYIGILRWAVELGRVDILLEVTQMSAHLACPRVGQLEQIYHIFGFLKDNPKLRLAFDPTHPNIDERRFKDYDWFDFYRDAKEAIPANAPKPRGKPMSMHCFVDADHASNKMNRRSMTGLLIFCNRAPITWYCKRQGTVETSTFGAEIVAMKTAVEIIEGLRYKLRMFGVELTGPTDIFCDNEAVFKNCSTPESTLKKKHHSISYHRNRQAVASRTVRMAKEDTKTNLSDLFTKVLDRVTRTFLLDRFTY